MTPPTLALGPCLREAMILLRPGDTSIGALSRGEQPFNLPYPAAECATALEIEGSAGERNLLFRILDNLAPSRHPPLFPIAYTPLPPHHVTLPTIG